MASVQDLERQRDALVDLKNFLQNFMRQLDETMATYNGKVQGLRAAGLPVQVSNNYEDNYCAPITQRVNKLVDDLEHVDLPYVINNIEHMEREIVAAAQSSGY